ncbi:MAG: DUF5119 domain-containing protein [Paludibacteraceae bacterium]|nr:DUF5119 domain-containing protein [Paludibacteraceae bacterium]
MRRDRYIGFVMVIVMGIMGSCKYKDLCYDHNHWSNYNLSLELSLKLDLDIDLEVSEEAHTKIEMPTYMKVCFYDPQNGDLVKTEFVGPTGGPLHVEPGTYNMVVYSFDTEWTQVQGESNVSTLEAFTSDITAMKLPVLSLFTRGETEDAPGPIIYTPDHLLVARKEVEIPPYSEEQHVITITATAATIVETYGFEVRNISGIDYISSVDAFVTNQAISSYFGLGEKSTDPATLYFPLEVKREAGVLKSTFNTFGKLPGESHSYLHLFLTDTQGNPFTVTEDITDQFEKPDHVIVIEDSLVIPKPEVGGGGIAPTVEDWDEVKQDVNIG